MKIRWKLLRLTLAIAMIPMILVAGVHRLSMLRVRDKVAALSYQVLTSDAKRYLQMVVDDYGRIVQRDRIIVEMLLESQADEVESRLASKPPASPVMYFSENYDSRDRLPGDMQQLDKYSRLGPAGRAVPIPVSFSRQVYMPVRGVDRGAIAREMACLSTMPRVYAKLHKNFSGKLTWLYTAMESGFHSSWPGHGGYPGEYDPRIRLWYTNARQHDGPTWTILPDVSTRTVSLTCSMAVKHPDGTFAGVTAIDVSMGDILDEIKLPKQWAESAEILQVLFGPSDTEFAGKLVIFVQASYNQRSLRWDRPVKLQCLACDDPEQMAAFLKDIAGGKSGVRRMRQDGRDVLWAYSAYREDKPLSVVVVPYDRVVAVAARVEQIIHETTTRALLATGGIMLAVILLAVLIAVHASREMTRPISRLAEVAENLAGGDFDASVDIRSGDELQDLGSVFNSMGPMLRDREKMKESLALAMEVQQHLLPQASPQLDGFDIAGTSLYSDETGGDYYDFIDMVESGEGKLGVAIGDITGHGIGAALLMASARAVLRSHATHYQGDLGNLFEDINGHLVRDTGESRFLTLFYGILDAPARTLRWTSGGHDPALWLHADAGKIEELAATGLLLGVIDDAKYEQSGPITLNSGDIVLVGTDGVWEARNPGGEMFGRQRLMDIIVANAKNSAKDIHQAVVAAVQQFSSPAPQEDDITLVVIKTL